MCAAQRLFDWLKKVIYKSFIKEKQQLREVRNPVQEQDFGLSKETGTEAEKNKKKTKKQHYNSDKYM